MPRYSNYQPQGVIPAILLPFNEDLSIDEASLRRHIRDVASTEGVSALTINGHSMEVSSCTFDEQRRVLENCEGRGRRQAAAHRWRLGRRQPRVFYADPVVDMHNCMKEALVLLGKLPRAVVRPPLVKLGDEEIAHIRRALMEAGLLGEPTRRVAA